MKRLIKRVAVICISAILLTVNLFTPVSFAESTIYELTFDNLFVFEQWANNPNAGAVCPGTPGQLTKDIEAGSFTLTNTSTNGMETYTAYSTLTASGYSMPVEPNTQYTFVFGVQGTTQSLDAFVFYYDSKGVLLDGFVSYSPVSYGISEWNFTTPENAKHIQIRFDNNWSNSYATVSDIRICKTEVYEYSKDLEYRKTYTYSPGVVYGELPALERSGYFFAGWFTEPDGKGVEITADTAIKATSYSLYSKWDPANLQNLTLVSLPVKQTYTLGEKLNTKGLVVSITYLDGTTENLDEGFKCSPSVLTKTGTQTVTVTYGDKSADFTVDVKPSVNETFLLNNSEIEVSMANYIYPINKKVSAFNRYEISYSSDAYVKGELNFNGTVEEFFLEPSENGKFSSYIDGFISGTKQSTITSISFKALNKDFMNFELISIDVSEQTVPGDHENMVYLSSEDYEIGIDLDWGGALTHMVDKIYNVVAAKSNKDTSASVEVGLYEDYDGEYTVGCDQVRPEYTTQGNLNLINCHDTGRLVQQSYYGTGDASYEPGQYMAVAWPYNPVQGGNQFNEASKIVDLKVTETETYSEIYIKCRPLDWAREAKYITPSYMEAWYTLENGLVRATCRFVDFSGYPSVTRNQEFPAFYCVEPLNNFVYYEGGEAWSDSNKKVTRADLDFWGTTTEQNFHCNENWGAFIGDGESGYGIGLYCPGQTDFCSGIFERDTVTSLTDAAGNTIDKQDGTSYIGVMDSFHFRSYTPISYCYYMTTGNTDTIRANFKELAQSEEDICDATYTNGFCDMCGKYKAAELTTDKYDINGDNAFDNVFEISNAGELYWFRDNVNAGDVNANAVLTADITDNTGVLAGYGQLSSNTSNFRVWEPIGNSANKKYNGYFDGQGHTVNGIYINDSARNYVGLFGYTGSNAYIEKIHINDSYFGGKQYVGCFVGYNSGTVENCCNIYSVANGTSYVGGTVGYTSGTVKNCYNAGIVSANNYVGGVAGRVLSVSRISNCYYLLNCTTDGSAVSQNGIGNATKGSKTADTSGATEVKTIEQFASGEVAYLLQEANAEQVWGQKTNQPGVGPVFDFEGKYKVTAIGETGNYSLVAIGDVENDGDIDVSDYQQLVNTALAEKELEYNELLRSDLDGDGILDVIDCSLMQLMFSGSIEKIDVYLKGDFDFDGIAFTVADITAIKKGIINNHKLSTMQKYVCDLNFDGILDFEDRELLTQQKEIAYKTPSSSSETTELSNKTANVIILSGQSNAYGASPLTQEVRSAVAGTDFSNVKIKYNNINSGDGSSWKTFFSNEAFETFQLGVGGQAEVWFGPEVGLSYYLANNETAKDEIWYIIKYTAAGTYLGGNWLYDATGKYQNAVNHQSIYDSMGGYLSDTMIPYVNSALDEIAALHGADKINIRSFMWMQGESDSCVKEWADQYGDLQNILVNKVRSAFEQRDSDAHIGFVDGGIAAYNSKTFVNPQANNATQTYNSWIYSDAVNTHKTNNASLWYVPVATSKNIINKTTAGLYTNTSTASNKLPNSIWIDTSTCKSKLENNVENGEYDGAHYCGESMFNIGQWFGYGMTQVSGF